MEEACRTPTYSLGEEFILIANENVGVILMKIKNIQITSAWAPGQVSVLRRVLVSDAAL